MISNISGVLHDQCKGNRCLIYSVHVGSPDLIPVEDKTAEECSGRAGIGERFKAETRLHVHASVTLLALTR